MNERDLIAQELQKHLAWQSSDGTRTLFRDVAKQVSATEQKPVAPAVVGIKPTAPVPKNAESTPMNLHVEPIALGATLDEIRKNLGDCQRCKLAQCGRKQIVFGAGNPKAQLMFVGEGPGEEEDKQGIPFVGAAGQLLTKMIEAMTFTRDEVYICNVVKCRPPENRNPEKDEIAKCEPYLKAQIDVVKPKVIVALGKFAAQTLLQDDTPITRMRGQWREYQGVPLMPTFHPAYLLRSPHEKKVAWADLQEVMKKLQRQKK
jgi:uracil-DNA glycosylase